jgi:hypothetical protein
MAEMQESETVELEDGDEPKRSWRRDLEDRAKTAETKASELETQLAGLQRAEAFRSAGIDPTDSRQSYFVKGYDGEIESEAIRTAAVEAGFISGEPGGDTLPDNVVALPGSGDVITLHQELAAQQRIAEAGVAPPVQPVDLNTQIGATQNEAELKALMRSHGYEFDVQG